MGAGPFVDIIWLNELNLVVLYPIGEVDDDFATAAVILKGEDGTDHFIPYDGFCAQAPLAFSLAQPLSEFAFLRLSVLGFHESGEPVELAAFDLDINLVPHDFSLEDADATSLDMRVLGFGERHFHVASGTGPSDLSEIGIGATDYEIVGPVDYSDLLATYLFDMRGLDRERFNGFFISALPRLGQRVGPCVHLRPLHHYQFGLALRHFESEIQAGDLAGFSGEETATSPLAEAAILSRHGAGDYDAGQDGFGVTTVPELVLHAGQAREAVDFVLRNGVFVHWRRQLEVWAAGFEEGRARVGDDQPLSFVMQPFDERAHLSRQDGSYVFRWSVEEAVLGDVIGVMFGADHASIDIQLAYQNQDISQLEGFALFVFMGDDFVPLTPEVWGMVENKGLIGRLEWHISQGLKQGLAPNYLTHERVNLAKQLFERDPNLNRFLGEATLDAVAERGPFGPEVMVYRDHVLRLSQIPQAGQFMGALQSGTLHVAHGKLFDVLRFDMFKKAPALAHVMVFNHEFRERFQNKTLDPRSLRLPLLEFVLSNLFSERLIDWALRLKGESQAILWHLALKRPHMVERLYELKLEPDMALNPFDDKSLDIAEAALTETSHIDGEVIEKQVIPVLKSLGDQAKLSVVSAFAEGLKFGNDSRKLNIGELSVCLGAVEQAGEQWEAWCAKAGGVFETLLTPLSLDLPAFETGVDLSPPAQLNELRRDIGHLIHRLVDEKNCDQEVEAKAVAFVDEIDAGVLLEDVHKKLDLALKYRHDLAVGVNKVYEVFGLTVDNVSALETIQPEEWPVMEQFGPTFAEPFLQQQMAARDKFEDEIRHFSEGVHPGDELFYTTLKASLGALEGSLPKLVWLEAGKALEERVARAQKGLADVLLEVRPHSSKLRRSKTLKKAVKQMVLAERIGPPGWPVIVQSLEIIEKSLAVSSP